MDAQRRGHRAHRDRLDEKLRARTVAGSMAWTVAGSALTLFLNLFTGILNARLLQPVGRGQVEAVAGWMRLAPILLHAGAPEGLAFEQARTKRPSATLNLIAIVTLFVLGSLTLLVTQLLIPYAFDAQADDLVQLARVLMIATYAVLGAYLVRALFIGANYFVGQTLLMVAEPVFYAAVALVLWLVDAYSVRNVLLAQAGSFAVVAVLGGAVLLFLGGLRKPSREEVRSVFGYGLRGHLGTLGMLGNTRLDLLLLPAVVAASQIGLYAVAVSVGSMMVLLFGQLGRVVFTTSVGSDALSQARLVERSLRLVLTASGLAAIATGALAPVVIPWVYGDAFVGAVTPLRLLLPGVVLWTAGTVLEAGLQGAGRPGRSSLSQLAGLAVTVVGLWWTLPRWGISGAAITSTLAYGTVFAMRLWYLRSAIAVSMANLLSPSSVLRDWLLLRERAPLPTALRSFPGRRDG